MKNYASPQIEVIKIELEGVLCASGTPSINSVSDGGSAWGE